MTRSVPQTNKTKAPTEAGIRGNCAKIAGLTYQPGDLATRRTTTPGVQGARVALSLVVTRMPRWRVDIVRKKAEHLGIITAPNAQEALNRASSLFRIEPAKYSKLMITKTEEPEVGRCAD